MSNNKVSKSGAVVKLIIWSVVLVSLLAIFLTLMIANNGAFNGFKGNFAIFSGYTYSDPDHYSVGNREYSEELKNIDIEWAAGNVTLRVYDGENVKVEETGSGKNEADRMRTRIDGGTLFIKYAASGIRFFGEIHPTKDLTVYIPKKYLTSLGDIKISAASADVTALGDIVCREIDLELVSGKLNAENIKADLVDVDTVSGNVFIKGEIGELDVSGVSAKVVLDLVKAPLSIGVETVSGDVDITLPENESFRAELDAVSGNMKVNSENVGTVYKNSDGRSDFNFESISGDVRITLK